MYKNNKNYNSIDINTLSNSNIDYLMPITLMIITGFIPVAILLMQKNELLKKLFKGLFLFVLTITLAGVMKVFLFSSFKVPTDSMEPAIVPGDFVLVNKLLVGPCIYNDFGFLKGKKMLPAQTIRVTGDYCRMILLLAK